MRSRRKINAFSLIAAIIVFALTLSGCGEGFSAQPKEPAGEHNARVMQDYITNSSTDELLDDFRYLNTDIRNDSDAIETESYENIATIIIGELDGDMITTYLYDAKRESVFLGFGCDTYSLADFDKVCALSDAEVEKLMSRLKAADTHAWREEYKGRDVGTGCGAWYFIIEYRDGTFESHGGSGTVNSSPDSLYDVMMLFWNYDYSEIPSDDEVVQPEEPAGEYNARVTADHVLNGSTDELLEDFGYLFENIRNDAEAAKAQDYEDVVTVFVEDYDGDMQNLWLYDAKRGTVFYDVGANNKELPSEYGNSYQLSDEERAALTDTLKGSGSHEWKECYPGENVGTGSYSWSVIIEYRDGTFEFHNGYGNTSSLPTGFIALRDLFISYFFGD